MNELILMIFLAIVQGITEWLPISSSGHLVLFQQLFSYNPGLSFDIALHLASILAVLTYFGKDILLIVKDFVKLNFKSDNGKLGIYIIIATIPAGIAGVLFQKTFESAFSSLLFLGFAFLFTSVVLLLSSLSVAKKKKVSLADSIIIGFAQIISIFPGVSRSGITMSAGWFLGLEKREAARFSFLMAVPIILGAFILKINTFVFSFELLVAIIVGSI